MKKTILLFLSVIIFLSVMGQKPKPTHEDSVKQQQAAIQNTIQWIVSITGDMKTTLRKSDALTADEYGIFLKGIEEYLKQKEQQFKTGKP